MNILEKRKAQKTLFKTKKGPSLVETPSQKERRNRLSSLTENIGVSSDGALSPAESPSKKTLPEVDESDSNLEDDDSDQNNEKKSKPKGFKGKNGKKAGSTKEEVLVIDDDSDSDDLQVSKPSKGKAKQKKGKVNNRAKIKIQFSSQGKKVQAKKEKTRKDSSSESDFEDENKKSKLSSKAARKLRSKDEPVDQNSENSDSDSNFADFISMVKGKGSQAKREVKKLRRGKGKKKGLSESEEPSPEESDNAARKTRSRRARITQKQTRKRPRKVTSSEDESKSTDENSDSDVPAKKKKKQNDKKEKIESENDDDSEEDIGRKKRGRLRRRARKTGSELDDYKRKKKQKAKGKQKRWKKHFIEDSGESEKNDDEEEEEVEEDGEEDVSPSKRKGRKKIRKLLEDGKLAEETRKARRLEEERRKRLLERTRNNELDDMPGESAKVSKLVLEADSSTKEPLVEVKEDLLQHLKPHQCKGIQFMYDCVIESLSSWKKEEPGGGCILAHCMGLGKTLQVVALVHTLMTHKDINLRCVLVVAPLNTVLNWQVEFEKWLAVDDRLEVYILQEVGPNNWRRSDMLKHWQRYGGVMIMGYSLYRNLSQCYRVRSKTQKKIFQEALVDPGPDLVICDEGHILRNDGSAISKALNGIKTKRRIALTGTPLQNNLIEYHCMVSFVKPNLLGTRKEFTNTFVNPIQNGQCADSTGLDVQLMKQRCHVLFKMLAGCVQRKDYSALVPFLPRKHEYVIKVRLSLSQRKLYEHYLKTFVFPEGDVCKRGVSLFSDYQALMRIWTHPWCLKLEALRRPEKFVDSDSMDDFVVHTDEEEEEDEEEESLKSTSSEEEQEEDPSSSESEKERRRKKRGGRRGKGGSSSDEDNSDDDDEDENESEDEVLPQSSKRKAAAARSAHSASNKASSSTVNIDGEDITVVTINDGASTSRQGDSEQPHSSKHNNKKEPMTINDAKASTSKDNSETNGSVYGSTRSGTSFKDGSDVEIEEEKEWYDEFMQEDDEYNVELSGKLVLLMEVLADAEAVHDKVLVFSQSLVTLDLIEKMLGGGEIGGDRENWCRGCDYFRMDGSTSVNMRQRWADIFNDEDNKTARLFLISTKAGGLGINLVAANRVVVFDVSWNPSHDVQSIFRVYRFGQTKAVYVYRLIAQGTMEEKIYDRQVTKLSMSGRVVDQQQIERHFTAADLRELYSFTPDILEEEKEKEGEGEKDQDSNKNKEGENEKEGEKGNEGEKDKESEKDKQGEKAKEGESESQSEKVKEGDKAIEDKTDKEGEKTKEKERPILPLPKDAVLADLITRLHPKWIVNYLEHDSLLQNIESEELTPEEMEAAWVAYEAEKSGQTAPAYPRSQDPVPGSNLQQQVAERIRLNSEMLQQMQQIRQLQEMQQRQDIEERLRQARQQQEQLYHQRRTVLYQQHQRQQDVIRRQNQMRFIQHMTQQPNPRLQIGQSTVNVQTPLPQAPQTSYTQPSGLPYQPLRLPPAAIRLAPPATRSVAPAGNPPTINLTLEPASRVNVARTVHVPNVGQVPHPPVANSSK